MPLKCAKGKTKNNKTYVWCSGTKAPSSKKVSTALVVSGKKKAQKEKVDRSKLPTVEVEVGDLKKKSVGALTKLKDKLQALVNSATLSGEKANASRKLALVKKAILDKSKDKKASKKKA